MARKRKIITPKHKLARKLKANTVHREDSADLWYFTHTKRNAQNPKERKEKRTRKRIAERAQREKGVAKY